MPPLESQTTVWKDRSLSPAPEQPAARPPSSPGRRLGLLLPLLLLAAALLLRVDWQLAFAELPLYQSPAIDEALHWQWAQDLAAGRGSPERPFFRAPFYPWCLGLLHRAGLDIAGLRWAGTLLGAASLLLLAWAGGRWLGRGARTVLLVLAGLSAGWIYYEPQLLLEHLVLLLLLGATVAWLRLQERPPGPADALFGLALGLAAITRPNALLLAPLALGLIWILREGRPARLWRLAFWGAGWLPPLLLVALLNGWPASGVLVASQGGVNLWIGNNPVADGRSAVLPGVGHAWERADASGLAAREVGRRLGPGEESDWYAVRARNWLRKNPGRGAALWLRKAALLLAPWELGNNTSPAALANRRIWMGALLPFSWWLVLLPGLAGLALGYPRHAGLRRWTVGALLLYGGSFLPFFINGRFRLPLLPLLALPAADLVAAAWERLRLNRGQGSGRRARLRPPPWRLALLALAVLAPLASWLALRPAFGSSWREGQRGWQNFQLGNAWLRLQQPDSARACYLEALRQAPALPELRLNLGLLELERRPDLADSLFKAELALDPGSAKAWNNLGSLDLNQGRAAEAATAFQEALRLRPDLADAAWNLGLARARLGLEALARRDLPAARAALEGLLATPYRGQGYRRLALALDPRNAGGKPRMDTNL